MPEEDWERVAVLETKMTAVEEGVANFRKHSARANTYFDKAEGVWEADKTRRARNWKVAMFVAIFAVPVVTWAGGKLVTALYEVLQIEQQWQQAHPSEFIKPQSLFDQRPQQNAQTNAPPQMAD